MDKICVNTKGKFESKRTLFTEKRRVVLRGGAPWGFSLTAGADPWAQPFIVKVTWPLQNGIHMFLKTFC